MTIIVCGIKFNICFRTDKRSNLISLSGSCLFWALNTRVLNLLKFFCEWNVSMEIRLQYNRSLIIGFGMLSVIRNDEHDTLSWVKWYLIYLACRFFCFSAYFKCWVRQNDIRDDWVNIKLQVLSTKFIDHLILVTCSD